MAIANQADKSALYTYYSEAEEEFVRLIQRNDLDNAIRRNPDLITDFEEIYRFSTFLGKKSSKVAPLAIASSIIFTESRIPASQTSKVISFILFP